MAVVDGRKKLWFLVLLHEMLHREHQLAKNKNAAAKHKDSPSHFLDKEAPKGKGSWFADSLFESEGDVDTLVASLRGTVDVSKGLVPAAVKPLNRESIVECFLGSVEAIAVRGAEVERLIQRSHANKRFGFHLDEVGCWDFNYKGFAAEFFPVDSPFERPNHSNRDPGIQIVSTRILYRAVRSFFMVPKDEDLKWEDNDEFHCDKHAPSEWTFRGEFSDLKIEDFERLAADSNVDKAKRAAAARVYMTFCGATSKRGGIMGHGAPIEDFLEAAKAYYLNIASSLVFREPPKFFRRNPGKAIQGPNFTGKDSPYEGYGPGRFGAALFAHYRAHDGLLSFNGHFAPDDDEEVIFTRLRVEISTVEPEVETDGKSAVKLALLPPDDKIRRPGFRYGKGIQGPKVEITADDTDGLVQSLEQQTPIGTLTHDGKAFDLRFSVHAPLNSIRPALAGANQVAVAPSAIVEEFIRARLARPDAEWKLPEQIPIIETGRFTFSDKASEKK
ncbi:MAG: hypothetical protein MUE83_10300 [Tabrizicola sp.]|nr:hypothetical protein [Tabrizicola sp.]